MSKVLFSVIIAGLEVATDGGVFVDGKLVTGPGREREVGVVFQQYAFFPTKTVLENVEFGLKLNKYMHSKVRFLKEACKCLILKKTGSFSLVSLHWL